MKKDSGYSADFLSYILIKKYDAELGDFVAEYILGECNLDELMTKVFNFLEERRDEIGNELEIRIIESENKLSADKTTE